MSAPEPVPWRTRARVALLLSGPWLAACAGSCADQPVPARVRLAECAGRLHELAPGPAVEVLREDFEDPPEGWSVFQPEGIEPEALLRSHGREDERTFLTLAGRGSFYRVIPVEGDAPYLFSGALRARGVVPAARDEAPGTAPAAQRPFFGAAFWVAESSASGVPGAQLGAGKGFDRRHPLASAVGEEGWQERRCAFRTRPETRSLIVACLLAVEEPLEQGQVDFDRVLVQRVSERELWELEAARAVAEAHRGDALPPPADWRARRLVGAMLGGEHRPALLGLPGERLELELDVPALDPVLECGLAPWPLAQRAGPEPLVHWLRVDGRELWRGSLPLGALSETGWRDVTVELTPYAGRRVRLELGVEGPLPGLFGAPVVRARAAPAAGWNVLLVSIDTLRADRVGAYGASSGATPRLDALARESLLFEDASANAPYTLPAHATLFSGQFPSVHGVQDRGRLLAPERSPVLARILAARGYRTQAFVAGGFLTPDFGFHAGFDGFSIVDPLRHVDSGYFAEFRRELPEQSSAALTAEPGVARVRRWIGTHAREPFFLFLHTYEVHDYDPPPGRVDCAQRGCGSELDDYKQLMFPKRIEPFPGTPEDRAHIGHRYDAALGHVDEQLGGVLDDLARLGLLERTLVIVTSDHGEELFEHGHLQHGKTLYDEILHIPLILRVPGRTPARVAAPAMQVDVAPTILGALGLPPDARMQGLDLLGAARRARPVWSEVDDHFVRKSSLREGSWKLVHGPPDAVVSIPNLRAWELYDLARDAREGQELSRAEPERLARMRAQLEAFQEHLRSTSEALGKIQTGTALDEATERLLEHLGY